MMSYSGNKNRKTQSGGLPWGWRAAAVMAALALGGTCSRAAGTEGKKEAIVRLLTETFHLVKTDADNQTKIRSRGAVNEWLRRRLAEKLWDWLSHRPETGTVTCPQTALGESSEPKAASEGASQVGDPLASKTPAVSTIDLASAIHSGVTSRPL